MGVLLYGLIVGGGALLAFRQLAVQDPMPAEMAVALTWLIGKLIAAGLLVVMGGALVMQWSWLAGRLVARWRWVAEAIGFFLGTWLVLRVGTIGGKLLGPVLPHLTVVDHGPLNPGQSIS